MVTILFCNGLYQVIRNNIGQKDNRTQSVKINLMFNNSNDLKKLKQMLTLFSLNQSFLGVEKDALSYFLGI